MPRTKYQGYYFTVSRWSAPSSQTLISVLDMLRYDQATVALVGRHIIVFRTFLRPPTQMRWASFGMPILLERRIQPGDSPMPIERESEALLRKQGVHLGPPMAPGHIGYTTREQALVDQLIQDAADEDPGEENEPPYRPR